MPPSPLAELAAAVRRLERMRADIPEPYRPSQALVFAAVDAVKADVLATTGRGKPDQALAIVADFERQAGGLIATKLAHAPLEPADG